MAVIEVCDICRKEVNKKDGITLKGIDWNGTSYTYGVPLKAQRKYKIKICDSCKENIIEYCRENMRE